MTDPRPGAVLTVIAAATIAILPQVGAAASTGRTPDPAAAPAVAATTDDTALAVLSLHGAGSPQPPEYDTPFQVLVEPASGRVQLPDDPVFEEIYVHVVLGHRAGTGVCVPELTIVLDGDEWPVEAVYDAEGARVPDVEQFPEVAEPGDVARLEVAPFAAVDCVDAAGHTGADPADPGELLVTSRAPETLSEEDVLPAADAATLDLVDWPAFAPYGGQVTATARYRFTGSWAPDSFRFPSRVSVLRFSVEAGPNATLVGPGEVTATDVDLWRHPEGELGFTVALSPNAPYSVSQPQVLLDADGTLADSDPGVTPVAHPVPTDWSGSLAGTTWWRPTSYTVKGVQHVGFTIVRFLDDEWVYLDGGKYGFDGVAPTSCTEIEAVGRGCHRYYYDEATGRLQVDQLRAEPMSGARGWAIPTRNGRSWSRQPYARTDVQLPVSTGARFALRGSGNAIVDGSVRPGSVVLRLDGTYRLRIGDRRVVEGRYRFLGGDRQHLRLDPRGRGGRDARTSPVQLYFDETRDRLMGIDCDSFEVLRGGF
ncbi:MAG TPA: hypothetical protein VD859_14110 [Nocardioides sp.]|nr:hypothetical protein [Nocardioides sp.]